MTPQPAEVPGGPGKLGPARRLGVMFPGQGTQRVGMGRVLERTSAAARAVFDTADDVLRRDVRKLCFTGPTRELTRTQNAQVAIFTSNAACLARLREEGHRPGLALGHSVGELNALVAAGVLTLADGLRLVAARGALMGRIEVPGTMAAVLGLSPDAVRGICERLSGADPDHPVVAALLNGPQNVVVSGAVQGVEAAERLAAEAGARKVTRLTVSSAFHSPLMAEAVAEWRAVVAGAQLREPGFPVVLNTTGAVATGADDARQALVDQLTGPVRWMEGVRAAVAAGADLMVEAGDSKVLSALVRAIDPGLPCLAMHDPRALRRLVPAQGQPGEPLAGSVAR